MVRNSDPRVPDSDLHLIQAHLTSMGFRTFKYVSRGHISRACKAVGVKKYAERFNQIYIRLNRCPNPNRFPTEILQRVRYRSTMVSIAWNLVREREALTRRSIPSTSTIFKVLFMMEGYRLPYFTFLKNKRKHREALCLLRKCVELIKATGMRLEETWHEVELNWDWPKGLDK